MRFSLSYRYSLIAHSSRNANTRDLALNSTNGQVKAVVFHPALHHSFVAEDGAAFGLSFATEEEAAAFAAEVEV